jgi:hypothetical protein
VVHPFHPLNGRRFELIVARDVWGESRVYFHDEQGQLRAIPTVWTTEAAVDPFVAIAAGRALFRVEDLLRLVNLVGGAGQ